MIAEAVLSGNEFSVEAMSVDGRHEVVAITGKLTTGAPEFVELGHWQPAELREDQREAVVTRTIEILDAIGHRIGPSHTEVMVDGLDVGLIETHTRFGGDQIWELTQLTTGRHFATETIFALLGLEAPEPGDRHGAASMRKLDWADPERISEVERRDGVVRVSRPSQQRPEDVTAISDSSDLTGYVLTVGDDVREAWSLAEVSCAAAKGESLSSTPVLVMSPAKVINHFGSGAVRRRRPPRIRPHHRRGRWTSTRPGWPTSSSSPTTPPTTEFRWLPMRWSPATVSSALSCWPKQMS